MSRAAGLDRDGVTTCTGRVTAIQVRGTAAVPAFPLLTGRRRDPGAVAVVPAVSGVVVFGALWPLTRWGTAPARAPRPGEETVGDPDGSDQGRG